MGSLSDPKLEALVEQIRSTTAEATPSRELRPGTSSKANPAVSPEVTLVVSDDPIPVTEAVAAGSLSIHQEFDQTVAAELKKRINGAQMMGIAAQMRQISVEQLHGYNSSVSSFVSGSDTKSTVLPTTATSGADSTVVAGTGIDVEQEIEKLLKSVREKAAFRLKHNPEKATMESLLTLLNKIGDFKDRGNILKFLKLISQAHSITDSVEFLTTQLNMVMTEHPELLAEAAPELPVILPARKSGTAKIGLAPKPGSAKVIFAPKAILSPKPILAAGLKPGSAVVVVSTTPKPGPAKVVSTTPKPGSAKTITTLKPEVAVSTLQSGSAKVKVVSLSKPKLTKVAFVAPPAESAEAVVVPDHQPVESAASKRVKGKNTLPKLSAVGSARIPNRRPS